MKQETVSLLKAFVERLLEHDNEHLQISHDSESNIFHLVLLNSSNAIGIQVSLGKDKVDYYNNNNFQGGEYDINTPHMGLTDVLLERYEDYKEYQVNRFISTSEV